LRILLCKITASVQYQCDLATINTIHVYRELVSTTGTNANAQSRQIVTLIFFITKINIKLVSDKRMKLLIADKSFGLEFTTPLVNV